MSGSGHITSGDIDSLCFAVTEDLKSQDLNRKAIARLKRLAPSLKDSPVEVHVTQQLGNRIFEVSCISPDRQYAKAFLDALIDEYEAFHRDNLIERFESADGKRKEGPKWMDKADLIKVLNSEIVMVMNYPAPAREYNRSDAAVVIDRVWIVVVWMTTIILGGLYRMFPKQGTAYAES